MCENFFLAVVVCINVFFFRYKYPCRMFFFQNHPLSPPHPPQPQKSNGPPFQVRKIQTSSISLRFRDINECRIFKYLLNPLPREKDTKFEQSQGDRGLGISICLGCHIVEPFSKMNVLTKQKQRKYEYNVADNWKFFCAENTRSLQAVL